MPRKPRVRNLLGRVVRRVVGQPPTVGDAFLPTHHEAARDFEDIADQGIKLLGAGVVQSWEGALAEMARALEASRPSAEAAMLTERFSDALVGLERPVQTLTRGAGRAVWRGRQAATESGRRADLTAPLEEEVLALPLKVVEGWGGTCDFLAPLFEALGDAAARRAAFAAEGEALGLALAAAAVDLRAACRALPAQRSLHRGLFDALDTYQGAALRAFELAIDAAYRPLLEAARGAGGDAAGVSR